MQTPKGPNQHLNQHSQHLQRIVQAKPAPGKMAPSVAAATARTAQFRGHSSKSVLQRMEVPSTFDATKSARRGQWVVTQVDSELGGMFGHSELFIESYSGVGNKTNYKIHVQTLNETRVDILVLPGEINLTHVRGSRSYIATDEQIQKIWFTARTIQQKMKARVITYAEIFPDRKPAWKDATKEGQVEMSCKSVTDTLLIEAGLRTSYGGRILNHPSDL